MVPTETQTVEFTPFKIDTRGHLFCGSCLGFGHGGEIEYAPNDTSSSWDDDHRCDGCHKPRASWPRVTQLVEVEVEHFTCKIF